MKNLINNFTFLYKIVFRILGGRQKYYKIILNVTNSLILIFSYIIREYLLEGFTMIKITYKVPTIVTGS